MSSPDYSVVHETQASEHGRKRKAKIAMHPAVNFTPDPTNWSILNHQARLDYLATLNLARPPAGDGQPSGYHLLIVRVLGELHPDDPTYERAWRLLHEWTKSWQCTMLKKFSGHLAGLAETYPNIRSASETERIEYFTSCYRPYTLQELMPFATQVVDFEKSTSIDSQRQNGLHMVRILDAYFTNIYVWILDAQFRCETGSISRESVFSVVKDIGFSETAYDAITWQSFILTPAAPTVTKRAKKTTTKTIQDILPSYSSRKAL